MDALEFTPDRERRRVAALLQRARVATPASPLQVLCPREAQAAALSAALSEQGGGFLSVSGWEVLCDECERMLALPTVRLATEQDRAAIVEAALLEHARADVALLAKGLDASLRVDPFGLAEALLPVLDELRLCGYRGEPAVLKEALANENAAIIAVLGAHLQLLQSLLQALDVAYEAARIGDVPWRLARIAQEPGPMQFLKTEQLFVEGVDRLAPLQRAVLERICDAGVRVDVAPWVTGWRKRTSRPVEQHTPPATVLEALARAPESPLVAQEDESVQLLSARDPDEEAEGLARWIASLSEEERAGVVVYVPAEHGYAQRIARGLERHGLRAGFTAAEKVQTHPLWQAFRACIRLAWKGPEVVELATVLTAPGSGIWGADRDRLIARLREQRPSRWEEVFEAVHTATDPERYATRIDASRETQQPDPARIAQLLEARTKVLSLLTLLRGSAALATLSTEDRIATLRVLSDQVLERMADPVRFRRAFAHGRIGASWTAAALSLREAVSKVLPVDGVLPATRVRDVSAFLGPIEHLLGSTSDGVSRRRADVVSVVAGAPFRAPRPETLLVAGFVRGRFPAPTNVPMLLGPVETEVLRSVGNRCKEFAGLSELEDDGQRAKVRERDLRRLFSLPTRRLLLSSPLRDAEGERVEPSLARRDVLSVFEPTLAGEIARRGATPMSSFVAECRSGSRAMLLAAVEKLSVGVTRDALRLASVSSHAADVLCAPAHPTRDFALGNLLRERIATQHFSPSALEWAAKCRYAFVAGSVLRLRELPLARSSSAVFRELEEVSYAALRLLDEEPRTPEAAVDAVLEQRGAAETASAVLAREDLRRSVVAFLRRQKLLRTKLETEGPGVALRAERPEDAMPSAVLPLATKAATGLQEVTVETEIPRVEFRKSASGPEAVLVQLRTGGVEKIASQREAGLGYRTALSAVVAENKLQTRVAAVATVSVTKPEDEVLQGDALARAKSAAVQSLSTAMDQLLGPEGDGRPHRKEEREALEKSGATSCEYCALGLLCRYREREGEP